MKIQQLLERLSGLLRAEARSLLSEHGLQPVQFEVLFYLSVCNRYSDTLMGVTEYLNQTKGTVSQTIKVLEKKGLIEKRTDETDKRVAHMSVTKAGLEIIERLSPPPLLESVTRQLDESAIASIEMSLQNLLNNIQRANNFKTFGQCASCQHNIRIAENEYLCGLTNETLSPQEVKLICREHSPGS